MYAKLKVVKKVLSKIPSRCRMHRTLWLSSNRPGPSLESAPLVVLNSFDVPQKEKKAARERSKKEESKAAELGLEPPKKIPRVKSLPDLKPPELY